MFSKKSVHNIIIYGLLTSMLLSGCGSAEYVDGTVPNTILDSASSSGSESSDAAGSESSGNGASVSDASGGSSGSTDSDTADAQTSDSSSGDSGPGTRDNTPVCLVPEHPGVEAYGNELATVDVSNASDGYVCVSYTGTCSKVKLQITCPNTITYTYNLSGGYETFPLTADSGTYSFGVYENISDTQYSTAFKTDVNITVSNQFGPYLYPNQYVNFDADDQAVAKGAELAYSADSDLDVVSNVYNYIINNITYDSNLASSVESGYLPTPDNTLASGTGICLDYAALMATMLRSQRIPTHMEVGYAGTAYHAWISVYLEETGWVNGIIEFNGTSWELMDPTFASSASEEELKEFIGDGSNYETKYIY